MSMSFDTSELTFIRCPSCRSLVPATSRRCRMCGFLLSPGDQTEQVEMQERREQRETERREAGFEDSRPTPSFEQPPETASEDATSSLETIPEEQGEQALGDANPLGDYLAEEPPSQQDEQRSEFESDSDDGGSLQQEVFDLEETVEEKEETPPVAEQTQDENVLQSSAASDDTPKSEQKRPGVFRVGRERRGGLTARIAQKDKEKEEEQVDQPLQTENLQSDVQKEEGAERVTTQEVSRKNDDVQTGLEEKGKMNSLPDTATEDKKVTPREHVNGVASSHSGQGSIAVRNTPHPGRIFGWFVSYDDPNGVSYVIREGKFFLSGSIIREPDFAVEHPSISTPHAMIAVNARGFFIQDLMSAHGVFTRRADESEWTREEEVFEVFHGDRVKFGEVEYLVCLVPAEA